WKASPNRNPAPAPARGDRAVSPRTRSGAARHHAAQPRSSGGKAAANSAPQPTAAAARFTSLDPGAQPFLGPELPGDLLRLGPPGIRPDLDTAQRRVGAAPRRDPDRIPLGAETAPDRGGRSRVARRHHLDVDAGT